MSKKNAFSKQLPSFQTPTPENGAIYPLSFSSQELQQKEKAKVASYGMSMKLQKNPGIFFGTMINSEDPQYYSIQNLKSFPQSYVGKPQSVDGHCAVFGSSGSGKGSCVAVPTMVSWGDSPMVVLDPKGDLYEYYCKIKNEKKRPAKVFNPAKDDTCTYDPFSHIRNGKEDNKVANVRELVNAIIPAPLDGKDRFWITAAQKILTGALLYYLDLEENNTNSESQKDKVDMECKTYNIDPDYESDDVDSRISMDFYAAIDCITSLSLKKLFKKINKSKNKAAKKYIRSFKGKDYLSDSEMLMDINETLDTYLMNFTNDMRLAKALTKSDNSIDWDTDIDKYNIFLSIPEDRIEQWGPLLNVMVTQLIRTLERRPERYSPEGANLKPVLLLLDEFPMIGKIDVLADALSMLRSKNVTILLIAQSISQLSAIYGHDCRNIMLENCDFQAVLRVNCADSQKYFSELAGTTPTLLWNVGDNYVSQESRIQHSNHSESVGFSYLPLIRPEEFAHLDKDLILFSPYDTFRIRKCPFFKWKAEIFDLSSGPKEKNDAIQEEKETSQKIPRNTSTKHNFVFRNLKRETE